MTQSSEASNQVTIIGAGLAGSLLSLFLARRGYRVALHERRPDMRQVEVPAGRSINLALAERGIHALERVGVMEAIRPQLIPMRGRMLHGLSGDLNFQPYGARPEEVNYSVSRASLNAILMTAAEKTGQVEIHFESRLVSVNANARRLTFERGPEKATVECDFDRLIGADGSASEVRQAIVGEANGLFGNEPLAHAYKELTIPAGETGSFRIEENALHIWPRGEYMLIALPNVDGSFTVTLFLPLEGDESFASLGTEEEVTAFFLSRFPDAFPNIPNLTRDFFKNSTGHLATIRCQPWTLGDRVLIIGDAAHAIVPFHGQGMNCAFEDCSRLDEILEEEAGDWSSALPRFEGERRPDADAIADMALENYVEMRSTVRDPKFHIKKEVAFRLEKRIPDRFIPRYSMVMFHRLRYSLAYERGRIQSTILDQLCRDVEDADQVDYDAAVEIIEQELDYLGT